MISVKQETERETALVDALRPRISISMEDSDYDQQWSELDGPEQALISLRDARKKLQICDKVKENPSMS